MKEALQHKEALMAELEQSKVAEIGLVRAEETERADKVIAEKEEQLSRYTEFIASQNCIVFDKCQLTGHCQADP